MDRDRDRGGVLHCVRRGVAGPALLLSLALLAGCQRQQGGIQLPDVGVGTGAQTADDDAPAMPVHLQAVRVEQAPVSVPIVATGSAVAVREAALGAGLTGRITSIHVEEGDHVEEGQLLVEVDDRTAQAMVQQAQAAATAAEVQATQAEADYNRLAPLAESGSIAQSRVDQLRAQMEATQESARAARAAARAAQLSRVDADLRAPFAGTVIAVPVEVGEIATSMPVTTLVRLADLSQLEVRVRVHERFLRQLTVGAAVTVRFPSLDITTTGQIYRVGNEIDPQTRTIEVVARIDNRELSLPSGIFAELTIVPAGRQAILLPRDATALADGQTYVWAVDGDRLARRAVDVLPADNGQVEVLSGLEPGQSIAVGPLAQLRDGAAVELGAADGSGQGLALTVANGDTP